LITRVHHTIETVCIAANDLLFIIAKSFDTEDASGTHSIFSTIEDISVMYHVSTMLPLDTRDNENPILERKRHIGNDVVVLIFKEGNTPIDPSTAFRSQFNRSSIPSFRSFGTVLTWNRFQTLLL
jgi:hypothetical protein